MTDMTAVIVPKSDQWNADDFIAGPMTFTITDVKVVGGTEQPVSISVAGSPKFYRPCKSMSRVLVAAWGPDAKAYVGRSLTLYRDPTVKWGGMAVGGIRISHMSDIEREMTLMLTMTKQNRAPHKVRLLEKAAPPKQTAPADDGLPLLDAATALRMAEAAARMGTDHFRTWFNTAAGKDCRASGALTPDVMARIKGICEATDKAMDADPFGLPPIDPAPTPEQIAAAEAAARAAIEAQDREAGAA